MCSLKIAAFVLLISGLARAQTTLPAEPIFPLGDQHLKNWTGVTASADGATLSSPGEAIFNYPAGPRGFYKHGFRLEDDSVLDWTEYAGIRFDTRPNSESPRELTVTLILARPGASNRRVSAVISLIGKDWQSVMLPWSAFEFNQAANGFLRLGKGISIAATSAGENIDLRNVRLVEAASIGLSTSIRGKSAVAGQIATYVVEVSNCTDQPKSIALSFEKHGWETMDASVEPMSLQLASGEKKSVTVSIKVSERVPPGGHELQTLLAIGNGDASTAGRLRLLTTSQLQHPYILHTTARWQEVREKVKHFEWAKQSQDAYLQTAQKWKVPEIAAPPSNDPNDTYGPFIFHTTEENNLLAAAYAWELIGDKESAEKVALFLRRLSDPAGGYPSTLRGCNQGLVQEGHFFQHIAMAYDMVYDSGALTDADHAQIEATFRLFMATIEREASRGAINNWNLSECSGAFYCALAMQDLAAADRFFAGPSGIRDQLAKGTMDDGWWYECSISYNMWCASEFTQVGLAYEPFGFNFKTDWVPASYSPEILLSAELSGGTGIDSPDPKMKGKPFGMDSTVFGPIRRPYRTITDLWNSLLPFIDYRGVMFGVNDSTESKVAGNRPEVSGQPFEIAYYAYRDPAYAAIIKLGGGTRDLLYGVPELPATTPELFRADAFADNVGLAMLRSQTPDRPIDQQIQAALHYGTHGWAHGHYDRTDLLALERYGRSFWNPESVFYVYEPFMYKFFTQTSVNHNMVVVDQKMQEATPGERLMFYSGKAMQATAVQTTARWSNPPYGGMVYDYVPVKTFEEKTWREGRYVPIPTSAPAYGTLTDFSEPILQRRMMIVTDDYVLLADYLKAEKQHTFDDLLQIKGFLSLDGGNKKSLRHDAQWSKDPLGSAQFVTDCNWFSAEAPTTARFEEKWGPDISDEGSRSNGNVPGSLKLDVHTLWPPDQQIMVGTAPEQRNVEKRLFWTVRGDGKTLAEGKVGAWILGRGDIDVPLDGVKQLELETRTELSRRPTLFWAGAKIINSDGKEISLATLSMKSDNIVPSVGADKDYLGGPVKISGDLYTDTIAAEPKDAKQPGAIHIDLTGLHAVRLKCVVGSDYPPGDESLTRKTFAVRSVGTEAIFLTVIEPYQDQPVVKSAVASDASHVRVELTDGRVQEIEIGNLRGASDQLIATLSETRDGNLLRKESAHAGGAP